MKTKLIASLFLLSVFAQGCIIVDDDENTITVYNESSFVIEELYIADVGTFDWGPNLLGSQPLFPDQSITVEVACDTYDIEVVDETGLACQIELVDVCFGDDAGLVIDDLLLDDCAFGVNATGDKAQSKHGHETKAESQAGATL